MRLNTVFNKLILIRILVLTLVIAGLGAYYLKKKQLAAEYYIPLVIATHTNGDKYVGSLTCMDCHSDIYKNHTKTAHYNSSGIANFQNIKGSFSEGSNILDLPEVKFELKQEQDSFFQHTKIKNRTVRIPPEKFDIVIGSGVRGQSYASWSGDELYQLQSSYHAPDDNWINSPGYPNYYLKRPIIDECLKCHFTYAQNKAYSSPRNEYVKEQMVYGIDCERCHGPSEKHVTYHKNNPESLKAHAMVTISDLTRKQRLDVCAQCHSGSLSQVSPGNTFSFLAGEDLENYYTDPNSGLEITPDVHANQYGLLTKSKCFNKTETMDCATCHNPHQNQRGETAYFNSKCLSCHSNNVTGCKVEESKFNEAGQNCIACHMPLRPSNTMTAQLAKDSIEMAFYIRTHLIGIYPD